MLVKDLLDLAWGNVLAPVDDNVLEPPRDAEVAVGLAQGRVAGSCSSSLTSDWSSEITQEFSRLERAVQHLPRTGGPVGELEEDSPLGIIPRADGRSTAEAWHFPRPSTIIGALNPEFPTKKESPMSRHSLSKALAAVAVLAVACLASAKEAGWVSLFNGKDLEGWEQVNGLAKYEVKDGTIMGSSVPNSPNSFLCTKKHYGDFELEFDVKVDPRLNSGVQIRSHSKKEYQNGRVHGYQVEIAVGGYSGGIYDEARRGRFLNAEGPTEEIKKLLKKDQWNHYRVVCRGDHIQAWVNDVKVTDLHDAMTPSGFIGLQVHGVGNLQEPLRVQWRNIRLRELPAEDAKTPKP
jgi:hypothetical protein